MNWNGTKKEVELVQKIALRAKAIAEFDRLETEMDVLATHLNGNPLQLRALLEAGNGDFMHDVSGIRCYLDRETGKLTNYFSPRYAVRG